jgi:peptidyl-prolyl cis-trans isomerase C
MLRITLIAFTTAILAAQTPTPEAKTPAPKVAAAPKADKVLARIADQPVRESDFELFLSLALNPQQRMQVEMVQGGKDQYRKQFLDTKVMQAAARKEGLDKQPDFRRKMDLMEMQVLVQELLQRDGDALRSKLTVNEADVKAYYDAHTDQFKTPESFSARHILVSIKEPNAPKDAKGLTEEEAKARVALASKALEEGKGWEAVAKEFSDDPGSKDKGGLYEDITYGSFVGEFEEAVRKQELAKAGGPVKTKYGFHLIQVEKRNAAEVPPFEKVKEKVQQKAQTARQEAVFQAYVDGLKGKVGFAEGSEPVTTEGKTKSTKKNGAKK